MCYYQLMGAGKGKTRRARALQAQPLNREDPRLERGASFDSNDQYHISSRKNRNAILRQGLKANPKVTNRIGHPVIFTSKGTVGWYPNGHCDIWQVNTTGLELGQQFDDAYKNEHVWKTSNVPADNLTLIQKAEDDPRLKKKQHSKK